MRRYPAYDPAEYLAWTPDPRLLDEFRRRVGSDPRRAAIGSRLSRDALLGLYRDLLRTRLHDIALKRWVRTGVLSKAWLGTGEEAVTVGAVSALARDRDVVCPMIRNAGALAMMGMPLPEIFRGYLATADAPGGGRDLHIGDLSRGVLQPISHMGTNVPVIAGVALAFRLRGEDRVALTWIGDGATRTAAFHEGMNLAAVHRLPAVFVLQNNQVALGTRADEHGAGDLDRWADAYGMASWRADGNHVLDMLAATTLAARHARSGAGPALVVADTFRMGGHATHDEREARATFPAELFERWGRRDPIGLYESYLEGQGVGRDELAETEASATEEVEGAAEEALRSRGESPSPETAAYVGFSDGPVLGPLQNRL
jgi:TPP-dependent pyruvate/acetoin dehydrogenase alpha subunit